MTKITTIHTDSLELFDTHAHITSDFFSENAINVLKSSFYGKFPEKIENSSKFEKKWNFQISGILNVATSLDTSHEVVKLSSDFPQIYAAVGIHPNNIDDSSHDEWQEIIELSKNIKVAAIGETGLDRYWDTVPFEIQREYFERHLDLAKKRNIPVVIHSRNCDGDMLEILNNHAKLSPILGVIHSFSSSPEVAEKFLEMGLYISFSGSVTYSNKKFSQIRESAKTIPNERILIETDSPFLTPHPFRGKIEKNTPLMTAFVAQTLSGLRNCSIADIAKITTANARQIFGTQNNNVNTKKLNEK
ncbi:MAG: TatD family hydrolase [Planctomycetaceae bacterium]|jgi:TatD DNase family protein|nr:TatD family hydrolase [Planctomycetaceae bacterium]